MYYFNIFTFIYLFYYKNINIKMIINYIKYIIDTLFKCTIFFFQIVSTYVWKVLSYKKFVILFILFSF